MAQEQPCKVLLIEDNLADARLMEVYLRGLGPFELRCANCFSQGVDMLSQSPADVVVLDLTLPDSDGLGTFQKLRDARPDVPIIVLTGIDDQELAVEAVRRGAQDYLVKIDVRGPLLVRAIRYAIERHKASCGRTARAAARIIGFVGAKGGVGASTVAVNVAAALARGGASTIFAELRPYPSSLHLQLQTSPAGSTSDFADLEPGKITDSEVASRLLKLPWDLRVLFGPRQWHQPPQLQPAQLEALLRGLAASAQFVILDIVPFPPILARTALQACNYTVIVSELEPISMGNVRCLIDLLGQCGISKHVIGVVGVNRTVLANPPRAVDLQAASGCDVVGIVPPAADSLLAAAQSGKPLVLDRPESNCGTVLAGLAARISANTVKPLRL